MINKKNKIFEELPIKKLLFKMSMPATIGMLVMTLYNIIDSIFIGQIVGSDGLAAITIIFPFMMLIISISMGIGIGSSSMISVKFGEKRIEEAKKIFSNYLFLIISTSIFIIIFSYIFTDKILYIFGSSDNILNLSKIYFSILLIGVFFSDVFSIIK